MATSTKKTAEKPKAEERYLYAVGRRKTAVAQVRLYPAASGPDEELEHVVNKKAVSVYFPTVALQTPVFASLQAAGLLGKFRISVVVSGGGTNAQAEAVRLGVARALVKHDELLRPALRAAGFLTRDSRAVERKKPGLKKARRAPQWAKR
jgi:small subunit ribosomal protein S9